MNIPQSDITPKQATFLSFVFPSLGLFLRGYRQQAFLILLVTILLGGGVWWIGSQNGTGAGILFWMLFFLPWWVFQCYQASLTSPGGIVTTWKLVWQNGHDIKYLGGLFLLAAFTDFYIIVVNPEYQLQVFCSRPTGALGTLVKLQSPVFHVLIGYGFLRLLRWGLFAYLVYAGYGLTNALVNFACEGYGRIRTVFFLTLLAFSLYVFFRRHCFTRTI